MSTRLESELRLLDQYNSELDALRSQPAEADPQASKHLQRQIDRKLAIYWKQIGLVKTQYPGAAVAKMHEAAFYTELDTTSGWCSVMMKWPDRALAHHNHLTEGCETLRQWRIIVDGLRPGNSSSWVHP